MIAASAQLGIGYTERLLVGISSTDFPRFARVGQTVIESNHPAFILGHLSLYPQRVVGQLGGDVTGVTPPADFERLFSQAAKCIDDPQGTIYPPMDQVVSVMLAGYQTAIEILQSSSDDAFRAENPIERLRDRFPTVGAAHAFYAGGHMMMHLGQLSGWRRAMQMSAA
jgi:hypothetical protein